MSLVQIQQHEASGGWENVKITSIVNSDDEIVLGKTFRILVDGEEVYRRGGRSD